MFVGDLGLHILTFRNPLADLSCAQNIMTGQPPFADESMLSFMSAMINMTQPSEPHFGDNIHGDKSKDEMWNLLKRCLAHAPRDRPNAREVKVTVSIRFSASDR